MSDERKTKVADDEVIYLHCMPAAWSTEGDVHIPGTTELECEECGQPIIVAPSGQRLVAEGGHAVCVPCGQEKMAEEGHEMSHPTDAQIKELKDALFRERL